MKKFTRMILFYVLALFVLSFVSIPNSNAWSFSKSANLYGKSMPIPKLKKSNSVNVDSVIKSINVYFENDYFHYGEYYPDLAGWNTYPAGSYVDGEHLGMHGYGISFQSMLSKQIPIWYEAGYSYLPGSGIYDEVVGQTNISHTTNMAKYGFRLGYVFNISNRIAVIPNFGYQFVNWKRGLPGLNSNYYHLNYYMIGVKGYYIPPVLNNKLWVEASAYYLNDIHDTVDIGIAGTPAGTQTINYIYPNNNPNFIMTPKAGYIIGAEIGYKLLQFNYKNNPVLSVSPYVGVTFEQNKMGVSNINSQGDLEPSDQYNQIFLKFGLKFGF